MGIYDRDYYQSPRTRIAPLGGMSMWSVNTWLIIINVAVFIVDRALYKFGYGHYLYIPIGRDASGQMEFFRQPMMLLEYWGHFSAITAIDHLQLWRFITFQFLHAGIEHILFNMIALFFFGPLIEMYLGSRRYLAFYLLCGMAGAASYLGLWGIHVLVGNPYVSLIGASAGIFGVLIAGAMVAPQATVLIYGIIPMQLRTMAWLLLAFAVYTVFTNGNNAGGQAAHLGGALLGFLLIKNQRVLNVFGPRRLPNQSRGL